MKRVFSVESLKDPRLLRLRRDLAAYQRLRRLYEASMGRVEVTITARRKVKEYDYYRSSESYCFRGGTMREVLALPAVKKLKKSCESGEDLSFNWKWPSNPVPRLRIRLNPRVRSGSEYYPLYTASAGPYQLDRQWPLTEHVTHWDVYLTMEW